MLLDSLYVIALLLLSPWLLWRAWRTGRYRAGLRYKLLGLHQELPPGAVWFHGVSVGEIVLLRQLVAAFRRRHPDRAVVISSTTDTGLEEVRKHFPDQVFTTYIPRNVRLSEAPSHGSTIFELDPRSTGAEAYASLGKEVIAKKVATGFYSE